MKKLIISIAILSYSLAVLASKNDGETRYATVKVNIASTDIINIQAKYTDLLVETWDKNEVLIEATVRFDGKMNSKMEKFLNEFEQEVNNNISKNSGELLIKTNLDEPNKIQIGSKNVGINISFGDDELKIEYKIKAPATNQYIINSSYRDVRLVGDFNEIELIQYSGDLKIDFIQKAKLNLKYGSAIFKGIGLAEMEIYEQEIESGSIKKLKLNAKYSDLEITEIEELEVVSYESEYTIGSIGLLTGNFKYGEMEITQGIGTARLTLYEEDIEARKIDHLTLENSKYSKIEVARVQSITLIESYEDEITIGALGSLTSKNSKYGKYHIDQLQGEFKLNGHEDEIEIEDVTSTATSLIVDGKYINISVGVEDIAYSLKSNVKYGKLDYNKDLVDIKKYIKDSDQLEVDLVSKKSSKTPFSILTKGYEMTLEIN
jgi:hypothetical protein